ncbi:SRPBCC family protein [Rathayibacter sp. YIM 133350]|uniref:SRPBCC family protein n=1 Tax=Rathayibacter sp. YIM 133350 TaxID=3131992 RepID=UPI00307EC07B
MRTIASMRELDDGRAAVRVEDVYETDIEDLWQACTTPDRLARWIAEVSGDLSVGGAIQARFTSSWEGSGRIDSCERPHHLSLTMTEAPGEQTEVEAWLTQEGDKTRLVVEERGLPLDKVHFYGAGWQAHLEDLTRSLAGHPSEWMARWTELTPAYEAMQLSTRP